VTTEDTEEVTTHDVVLPLASQSHVCGITRKIVLVIFYPPSSYSSYGAFLPLKEHLCSFVVLSSPTQLESFF